MKHTAARSLVKLWDKKLTLYQRSDSHYWWCCFYLKRKQIRTSTKCTELEPAKNFASTWFFQRQADIANGIMPAPRARHFGAAADKAVEFYEQSNCSPAYVRSMSTLLNSLKRMISTVPTAHVNQQTWNTVLTQLTAKQLKPATVHQYRNALQIVLREAYRRGEITVVPKLLADNTAKQHDTPRTYFTGGQYTVLWNYLRKNIAEHKRDKTKWIEAAEELRDYVQFAAGSGMRMGEAMNVRFKDVSIATQPDPTTKEPKQCLIINHIKGKQSRSGVCRTYFTAYTAFMRCVQRQGLGENWAKSDANIFKHYHRDMFRKVLTAAGLRFTDDNPPRKRDLMSLRHTYICFALERGIQPADIAKNLRTSSAMIDKHYAKWRDVAHNENLNRNFTLRIDAD